MVHTRSTATVFVFLPETARVNDWIGLLALLPNGKNRKNKVILLKFHKELFFSQSGEERIENSDGRKCNRESVSSVVTQ